MAARRLILASASPARLRLLHQAGIHPEVTVSGVHEKGVHADDPAGLALILAERKATAVAARCDRGRGDAPLVLGCDSVLGLDGVAYGKPPDAGEAVRRWRAMRGRQGTLFTGHCLVDTATAAGDHRRCDVAATSVHFGQPDDAEIDAYVATGEPMTVAGGFTLDGRGGVFVDGIDGDPSNVVGLSLPLLRRMLLSLGVTLAEVQEPPG